MYVCVVGIKMCVYMGFFVCVLGRGWVGLGLNVGTV